VAAESCYASDAFSISLNQRCQTTESNQIYTDPNHEKMMKSCYTSDAFSISPNQRCQTTESNQIYTDPNHEKMMMNEKIRLVQDQRNAFDL